ncbi:MAG: alpha/beta fold hydrolase, partial [Bacteroidetes bacterium]
MTKLPAPPLPGWIADMLPEGITRYRLQVGDMQLHLMERGQGYPVLLLHGNPTWGFLYRNIVRQLPPESFRCIMPDLVGLGFSDKPRQASLHSLANHAAWIGGVLDQLALQRLIFVGQDWGGPIGLHALSQRPGLMQGLVLLNTMTRPPKPNFRPTAFHRFARMPLISDLVFRGLGYPQRWLHIAQGDPGSIRGQVAKAYHYPLRGLKNNLAPLALARMVPNSQQHPSVSQLREVESYLKTFEGPASIIWGLKDPVLGRAMSAHTKLLPHASAIKTQAGHFIQEEEA